MCSSVSHVRLARTSNRICHRTLTLTLNLTSTLTHILAVISPYFITSPKTQKTEFENPLILLVEKKVSSLQSMLPLLEQV